jgi:hypothetical protein
VPTLALYPFRFRDPLSGTWIRARHKMQVPEMQRHYGEWEITGAPEVRHVTETSVQPFSPFALSVAAHYHGLGGSAPFDGHLTSEAIRVIR